MSVSVREFVGHIVLVLSVPLQDTLVSVIHLQKLLTVTLTVLMV